MVFSSENIPFSLNVGLDFTLNEDYSYEQSLQYISLLQQSNIDYIVSPISLKNQEIRRKIFDLEKNQNDKYINENSENIINTEDFVKPIFVNDYQMNFFYWKNKFVSKIHNEDLTDLAKNLDIISQDLNYANYINSKSSIIEIDLKKIFGNEKLEKKNVNNDLITINEYSCDKLNEEFYLVKLIKKFLSENQGRHLSILLNFSRENFFFYLKLQSQISNTDNFEVILKMEENLPDEVNKIIFFVNYLINK